MPEKPPDEFQRMFSCPAPWGGASTGGFQRFYPLPSIFIEVLVVGGVEFCFALFIDFGVDDGIAAVSFPSNVSRIAW